MLKLLLLLVLGLQFSLSSYAFEGITCSLEKKDGKKESIQIPALSADSNASVELSGNDNLDLVMAANGEINGTKIRYGHFFGAVECEACRAGYTKTHREVLEISSANKIEQNGHYFHGEAMPLKENKTYKSISCTDE